ncbi:hypothetical protein J7M23_09065 [Candidatus Sumerlaeota bacterium]|nr:hypothetical protein [Candidatus Sumerlaeota bacterium]
MNNKKWLAPMVIITLLMLVASIVSSYVVTNQKAEQALELAKNSASKDDIQNIRDDIREMRNDIKTILLRLSEK